MFTGLIETLGTIERLTPKAQSVALTIAVDAETFAVAIGNSVSVSGVCLTVESMQAGRFTVTAVAETLERSTLGHARSGERVNLERALSAQGRFEGHIMLGHVDGVGRILSDRRRGESIERTFEIPRALSKFVAEKGSIALDGISLTIAKTADAAVTVALIPHTLAQTTMGQKRPGDTVNIEIDVLARYLEALVKKGRGDGASEQSFTALENFLS